MDIVRAWFSLSSPVSRAFYVRSGFLLMAIKYSGDALAVWLATSRFLDPLSYLNPVYTMRMRAIYPELRNAKPFAASDGLFLFMALWALPFLWIGISMSVRRAIQGGLSPWVGVLFGAPFLNYIIISGLSFRADCAIRDVPPASAARLEPKMSSALLGLGAGVCLTLAMTLISTYVLKSYGSALFMTTPILIGAASGFFYNRHHPKSLRSTIGVACSAVSVGALCLLLFAVEGVVCLAMALPLAWVMAAMGAVIGSVIAMSGRGTAPGLLVVALTLPAIAGLESWPEHNNLYEVMSHVEIDAPPQTVWQHVIGFSDLPAPHDWAFKTGIAYPLRATIQGRGVGAVRHCVFSTGPFVEPITHWEEPTRLAFDVASQPPPMQEWSPFKHVHPPHLDGYLRSKRGEFKLIALNNGRTRLEGRTWYELDLWPQPYFTAWSHWTIQRIHGRVLSHVKSLAERDVQLGAKR